MAARLWEAKLSYGLGGNYTIEVTAPTQSHARKVAENQTGDKCIGVKPA